MFRRAAPSLVVGLTIRGMRAAASLNDAQITDHHRSRMNIAPLPPYASLRGHFSELDKVRTSSPSPPKQRVA